MGSTLGGVPGLRTAVGTPTLRMGDGVSRPSVGEVREMQETIDRQTTQIGLLRAETEDQAVVLLLARRALLRHDGWCGFNVNAEGDTAYADARDALDAWWLRQSG